ncbi:nitrilase-related carbon-nitrogen hydrolase [Rhodococcus opacus]|uniref:nitrilase-related carbon-nitrogen hydrolase n=1 Tax=Rhodococcus opacus TaxID=37919 RepID=UPI002955B0FA|nr:nitrilase-related carbon-nitrogen hydrolase [Rhodococcus opacus]MDV7087638.1 nitrilase-related carbon-nitrogen hydrolase [Rhodococcus opacus]
MTTSDARRPASIRVVLAQLAPKPRDLPANAHRVRTVLRDHRDADLAVFPELFLTGYQTDNLSEIAVHADGPELQELIDAGQEAGTSIIVGFVEARFHEVTNSLACIDHRTGTIHIYRKTHLFGHERAVFTAGQHLSVVELAGIRIAPLVCFDIEFPEPARTLCGQGADLIVSVAANMDPYYSDHELASRSRALDNRTPHLYINRPGHEIGLDFVGGSRIIASDGTVLAQADRDEEMIEYTVDLSGNLGGSDVDYLDQLRPELYSIPRPGPARQS